MMQLGYVNLGYRTEGHASAYIDPSQKRAIIAHFFLRVTCNLLTGWRGKSKMKTSKTRSRIAIVVLNAP